MSTNPKIVLLDAYAQVAQALSAPARLLLLEQLAQGESGVERAARKTGLSVANCSQHLQLLRRAGLVTGRRAGKAVVYKLSDPSTLGLMDMLRNLAERNLAQVEEILSDLAGGNAPPEALSRAALGERLAAGTVTLLDMRPADEFAAAHIPGAMNVELRELDKVMCRLDPGAEIVAYCRGPYCLYAHQAVAALRARGFDARRLEGGLPEWRADGREVAALPT